MSYTEYDTGGGRFNPREEAGRRTIGIAAALAIEALLLLLLLTLSQSKDPPETLGTAVTTFDAAPDEQQAPEPPSEERQEPTSRPSPVPQPAEPLPQPPLPSPSPAPAVILPRRDVPRDFDLARVPQAPATPAPVQPAYGPQDTGFPGDSRRVGTAPDGSPLYAAEWYREPSERMLGDYLSTARGPGWGLIACRTEPEWRVVDCVALGEYPERSGIARAVLAAAWEFQVRPPRLRGRYMYGEWVRIRIDYEIRRQ